jgi:hypothetical protein
LEDEEGRRRKTAVNGERCEGMEREEDDIMMGCREVEGRHREVSGAKDLALKIGVAFPFPHRCGNGAVQGTNF